MSKVKLAAVFLAVTGLAVASMAQQSGSLSLVTLVARTTRPSAIAI
jgi:hypothetical protein